MRSPSTSASMRPTTPSSSSPATSPSRRSRRWPRPTYGALQAQPRASRRACGRRSRRIAPPRRVELKDPRAGNASVRRFYLAPAITNAAEGEAEALYLLMKIAGNGTHQPPLPAPGVGGEARLQRRRLVLGPAASTAARSASTRWRREGVPLDKLEAGDRPRPARAARGRRHRRRARARQEGLHRRFHLRVRQPERRSPGATPRACCSA